MRALDGPSLTLEVVMKSLTYSIIVMLSFSPIALAANDTSESERLQSSRLKAAKNPRNKAFSESFERVSEEVQKEEVYDDPFIDNYGNGTTTNRRLNETTTPEEYE